MKLSKKEGTSAEVQAKHTENNRNKGTENFNILLLQTSITWALTLLLALTHLYLSLRMVPIKCESQIVLFNARCAGALLVFGCLQSLSVALFGPLKVIRQILLHDVESLKKDSDIVSRLVAFGNIASGIVVMIMPLYGFYASLDSLSCKEHAPRFHIATVVLSCIDSFVSCGIFWVLVRGKEYKKHRWDRKECYNKIKQNIASKHREK